MRILAIRGKNLASLEGEFEVDFTVEPLCSAGIFAITGSTGSGKSTLLDAICLALYNDTPRISRAADNADIADVKDFTVKQKDCRNILRRGTPDGYAEVDFVALSGEKYRSRWSVRRSRDKVDGSLQNATFSVYNLSSQSELKGTKTELLKQVVELVGLSFDQFTRAVLLAQGDFATFLKAPQKEKAELLEKLTGTDIYSRISAKIYESTKLAEQNLSAIIDKIRDVELLTDEQIEEFATEKKDLTNELELLKKEVQALSDNLKWIETDEQLARSVSEAKKVLERVKQSIVDAKERFDTLALIESVQGIRDDFKQLENNKKSLTENRTQLLEQQNLSKEIEADIEYSKQTFANCKHLRDDQRALWEQIEPQVKEARVLDVKIEENAKSFAASEKELKQVTELYSKCEKDIVEQNKQFTSKEEQQQEIAKWFIENTVYTDIIPRIELIITYIEDSLASKKQEDSNSMLLESTLQSLTNENLLLTKAEDELKRLNNLLPAEIALLRSRLIDGEPCLVCGSVHHPKANETGESLEEKALKESKTVAEEEMKRLSESISNRKDEITRLESLITTYKEQHTTTYLKLSNSLNIIEDWESSYNNGSLADDLKQITKQWNNNLTTQNEITQQLSNLKQELSSSKERLTELENSQKESQAKRDEISTSYESLKTKRVLLLDGKSADEVESTHKKALKSAEEALNTAQDIQNKLIVQGEKISGSITQLSQAEKTLSESISKLNSNVDIWLKERKDGLSYEELSKLLLKDVEWLTSERLACNELKKSEHESSATLIERERILQEHQTAKTKPSEELHKEDLETELFSKNELLTAKQKRIAEIEVMFDNHEKGKERIKQFEGELKTKGVIAENWRKLNELLGSADGAKFKVLAQGYTLDVLLRYANSHLKDISQRYLLERVSTNSLSLQVVDLDMLSEVRSVHSLSGGESFLISLALALGLSSLSSNKMRIESLFIDEGFGSLDADTLRVAMDALERLQTQGRKIGVISHVAEMTERIPTQVKVIKTANGKSRIEIK